jgi:excisionase family DNA binding protein
MEELWTLKEAAARLKVSVKTVKEWLYSGELKGYKAGRQWRITPAAVQAFLEAGQRKAAPRQEGL